MELEENDHEWELSKENVQPLRQGRQMSSLAVALHSAPNEQVIKENQRAFEEELRAYTGDDPFDVWDRYIKWTEQYFPKGGHEGYLSKLVQRCLQKYQTDPSYINDSRFIRLWIKFASTSDEPTEVYTYMFDNAIGCKVASFYVEWALALEMDNNVKEADTVYSEGLNRLAEPRDLLLQKRQQFEYRLARNIKLQKDGGESEMEVGDTEEERTALCRLKSSGARHKVGTTRTGGVKLGSAGLFKTETSAQQVAVKGISIFVDKENASNSTRPQATHEWKSMPRRTVDNRENDKKPCMWTDARVCQQPRDAPSAPSYQIHEDTGPALETPQKTTFVNKQPLSSRKADPPSDVLSEIRNPHLVHPNEGYPQYQKHNVYNGVSEFSFEELRAIQYWKRKKERELEAEKVHLEEQRRQRLQAQVREQGEMIARMQNLLQSKDLKIESLQTKVQEIPHEQQQLQQLLQVTAQDQPPQLSMQPGMSSVSSQAKTSQDLSSYVKKNSSDGTSVRQEMFSQRMEAAATDISSSSDFITPTNQSGFPNQPGSTTSNTSTCSGSQRTPIFNDMSTYLNKSSRASNSSNSSLIKLSKNRNVVSSGSVVNESSNPAYNNSSLPAESGKHSFALSTPGSNETSISQKPPYGMPSPTVCTKEALQLVQVMFCSDLEQDNVVEPTREPEKPMAFKICEDDASREQKPNSFQIHCDEQSAVPVSGKKEKAKSFGLRKSFVPMYDGNDFTIEGQALDDLTIAPLGNFSMQARAASTPFSSSHIKPMETNQELHSEVSLDSCSASAAGYEGGATAGAKTLSPITEGSDYSGSHEETQSTKCNSQMSELGVSTKARTTLSHGCSVKEDIEEAEGDVSMYDDEPLDATHHHLIDISACGAMHDERTQDLLSASVCKVSQNPFDEVKNAEYLKQLDPPLSSYPNYQRVHVELPDLSVLALVQLDEAPNEYLSIEKCLGEGGYAKVLLIRKISIEGDGECLAMKVQKPPCYWEFYAACEMRKRLTALNAPMDVTPAIADMQAGYFYEDGSLLIMNYMEHGTLLNLVNLYKADRNLMAGVEPFACLLTIELLHLIEQLHKSDFIHGDVKPDNCLLRNLPKLTNSQNRQEVFGSQLQLFCLTDFGQSIDLKMFPQGTTFKAKVVTRGFQCIEMRTDRPWTFQTDLFGLAGTIHVALFGSYMKVFMERGIWKITSSFVRKWNTPLWKKLFHQLLNIPSCDLMPNLTALRQEFEDYMMSSLIQPYNGWVQAVSEKLSIEAALENTI